MKQVFAIGSVLALILAGSNSGAVQQKLNAASGQLRPYAQQTITVLDDLGHPVPGATVMVGYDVGNPFPGNSFTTDASGTAAIAPAWKDALPLTVQAAGYVTTTVPVAIPGSTTVQISKTEGSENLEVKGTNTDFGRIVTDGNVDFGLIIPAISRQELLGFNLSLVLSPQTDPVNILGKELDVPSNITLPDQTESYIFPVELNKPDYRTYMRSKGSYDLAAIHGQFPLVAVIDDVRAGKSIFELVNHFNFLSGSITTLDVEANIAGKDLSVNKFPLSGQVSVTAPTFANGFVMLSLPVIEQNGKLLPTDLKRFAAGDTMNLKTNGSPGSILSVLMNDTQSSLLPSFVRQIFNALGIVDAYRARIRPLDGTNQPDFTQLSYALAPANNAMGTAPQFLPMVVPPTLNAQVLQTTPPALPAGLSAAGMLLVYSEIETMPAGKLTTERRTRLWQVMSDTWANQIELPKLAFTATPDRTYRWEVMFLARPTNFIGAQKASNLLDLSSVTHVTRNALNL